MDFYESKRYRIKITADDFGMSQRANKNTLYLASLGKISRVGFMVHGKFSDADIDELNQSGVKIDIHLDILHEFDKDRKKREKAVMRLLEFFGKIMTRKISSKKVENEWRKQIKKFKEIFGRYPDGINSHEHVHFFPPFFKIAIKLQKKYSIPYIRFGDSLSLHHNKPVAIILHFLRMINKRTYKKSGSVSSDSLISLDWIDDLEDFMENLPEGTVEIACHPEIAEEFVKVKQYF
jgi:chitin disaccharide deacetylase